MKCSKMIQFAIFNVCYSYKLNSDKFGTQYSYTLDTGLTTV